MPSLEKKSLNKWVRAILECACDRNYLRDRKQPQEIIDVSEGVVLTRRADGRWYRVTVEFVGYISMDPENPTCGECGKTLEKHVAGIWCYSRPQKTTAG